MKLFRLSKSEQRSLNLILQPGNALGIDVHDVGPTLSYKVVNKRIPGNVAYTVEPALYFEKEFGIRLEDDVIVLDSGIERLVKAPEEPIYL